MMRELLYKISKNTYGWFYRHAYARHFPLSGKLVADRSTRLIFKKGSKINIEESLILNGNSICNNKRSSIIRLDEDAVFNVRNNASIYYGADIILFKGAELTIGNSFINSDCRIRCHKSVMIGDDCAISHDFLVMDSDAHFLNGDNHTSPVIIGNHVWIGTRVTILSGVTVGDGAVIAAGSLVKDDIPEGALVAGVPAKTVKENVRWRL